MMRNHGDFGFLAVLLSTLNFLTPASNAQNANYSQIKAEAKKLMEAASKDSGASINDIANSYDRREFDIVMLFSRPKTMPKKQWLASRCDSSKADPLMVFGVSSSINLYQPLKIAIISLVAESILSKSGIPSSLWSPSIESLDRQGELALYGKENSIEKALQTLTTLSVYLNEYQRKQWLNAASLAPPSYFEVRSDCPRISNSPLYGSGRALGTISVSPVGGRVALLPAFIGNLCKATKTNPYDPAKCHGWRDQPLSFDEIYAGQYYVMIKWENNGKQHNGIILIKPSQRQISLP
jgi:hypothetical protein